MQLPALYRFCIVFILLRHTLGIKDLCMLKRGLSNGLNYMSKKKAIRNFLIWQGIIALVLGIGVFYLDSVYTYAVVFFIELLAFSRLENALVVMPESIEKYTKIYENGIDATASVIGIERTNSVTEFGQYYVFTHELENPPLVLRVEEEGMDSQPHIIKLKKLPIRYLPET